MSGELLSLHECGCNLAHFSVIDIIVKARLTAGGVLCVVAAEFIHQSYTAEFVISSLITDTE